MPRLLSVLALAALALPVPSSAQAFRTDSGTAEFTSSVPLHSFTGTSDRLAGRIDLGDGTVDFFLDLETLETGIGKRDKDMRKTLEADEYPFASFYGRFLVPVDSTSYAEQPVRVTGAFSIHGVEREIGVYGTVQRTAEGLRVRAEWILKLTDYDIVPPRLLIVKVDEVQRLRIDALLTPETP